jgi:hypothetical protein
MYILARAPLWAATPGPAGFVARSSQTKGYARRSRLAIGPGSLQQNAHVIPAQTLRVISETRILKTGSPSGRGGGRASAALPLLDDE